MGYDHLISVVDTISHTEVFTIDMGAAGCYYPVRPKISPDGAFVYVACETPGSVAVISTATHTVVGNVLGLEGVFDVAFTSTGSHALVTRSWDNQVTILNTSTLTVTSSIPTPDSAWNVVVHPFQMNAYVSLAGGSVLVIDTTTFEIVDEILVGVGANILAVTPNGQWLLVGGPGGVELDVIDTQTHSLVTTIAGFVYGVNSIEIVPDSSRAFVASGDFVFEINLETFSYINAYASYPAPLALETSCDGAEIYIANFSDQLPVVDADTYALLFQIPLSTYWARSITMCPQVVVQDVILTPGNQMNLGTRGEVVGHETTLINATGITDTFTLTLGSHAWDTSLSDLTLGPLAHGEMVTFTTYVTVPLGAPWYMTETVAVTATSVTSPALYLASANMTTQAYAPPAISVSPQTLTSTQFVNEIVSQTMTISNGVGVTLTYALLEYDDGWVPTVAPAAGQGEWLYQLAEGVETQNSLGQTEIVYPSAYRWHPDQPVLDLKILVYANNPAHPSPNTLIDQALQYLGLGYTAHYYWDWSGFNDDLVNETWDIVIVGDDRGLPPPSTLDALNNYVLGGGKLILHARDLETNPFDPLWATLGFSYVDTVYPPPLPVEWWVPQHPAFNIPEDVPELTEPVNQPNVLGQYGNPLEGFEAIAGYTETPTLNKTGLIIGNNGRTVFKSFLDIQAGGDLDGDSKMDAVELWINLISGLQTGFATDVLWLSETPISGGVGTSSSQIVDITFNATHLQPGEYYASLAVGSNDPILSNVVLPVTMTVQPTANMGWVEGYVTDAVTGNPLDATLIALGQPFTVTTQANTGYYKFWLEAGNHTLQVAATGYVSQTAPIIITAQQGQSQDFAMILNVPIVAVAPPFIETTQWVGQATTHVITLTNHGPAALTFQILERETTSENLAFEQFARTEAEMSALFEAARLTPDANNSGLPTIARYPVEAFAHLSGPINILAWTTYTDYSGEYQNTLNALAQYTTFTLEETTTSDPVSLSWLLANTDVFLIPEQEGADFNTMYALGLAWADVLHDFVQAGGTLLVLDHCYQSPGLLIGAGLMEVDFYTCGGDWTLSVFEPTHPLAENLPSAFMGGNGTGVYITPQSLNVIGAPIWNNNPVVSARELGAGHLILMGFDFYSYNDEMAQVLANAINWLGGDVPWISTVPVTGTVPGYSALPVEVTLDASGLQPGIFTADWIVKSNDPITSSFAVPITMTVQPTPNMGSVTGMVSDAWTSLPLTATVTLQGVHTTIADPGYTLWADAGTYTILATSPGYYTGTWTVTIEPGIETTLDLALEPDQPRLAFAPFPLEATVYEGSALSVTLVLSNTGPAPLLFELHELSPTLNLTAPSDLTGKHILYDMGHGETWYGYFSTLMSAAVSAGATVTIHYEYPLNAATLNEYDVLWISSGEISWTFEELNLVYNWLNEGGAVLVQGEASDATADIASIYNIFYQYGTCNNYETTTDLASHPVTYGIEEIFIEYTCYYLSASLATDEIVYDPWGQVHGVAHEENGGKMIVLSDDDFFNWNIEYSDNFAFGLNVLSWLADPAYTDVSWLATMPVSGTVSGHSNLGVTVNLDASQLSPGNYTALLALEHNTLGLVTPVEIPVNLTVQAVQPGVVLTPAGVQASAPPGETLMYTFTLTNTGNLPDTFTLQVDSTWPAGLSALITPLLDPGESYTFTLTVTIPMNAQVGENDLATVTVISQTDASVLATAQATSTAESFRVYLPLMRR
ncbi:MAG: carboxypeptidase regulatory-like domain-containing protein [Anaerolineales bacterium]|nr:carboxypeptidase regulatory-like domain-containing protein [Anaerolineales bacterium]